VPTRAEKGGFTVPLQHVPQVPPIRVGIPSSLAQSEHLALAYWYVRYSNDSIPTEVAACRIEAIQASAASGVRSPEAVARSSHHQASVGRVRRPSPFVRSMEPPWCGNPYGLRYAVGTLLVIFYELLENSLGEGKLHDPASPSGTKTAN